MKYPLFKVHIDKEAALKELDAVLSSGFINEGEQVIKFNNAISEYFKHDKVMLLNSCTSALTLALKLAGVKQGDSVITPSMTCVASNTPIYDVGARILWADIRRFEGNIDLAEVDKLLNSCPDVKAVLCVNWAGLPCNLKQLWKICKERNVKLIQDAAHSFGAIYDGKHVCHSADYTCYSLQAIKHVTTGDGGILVCNDQEDYERGKRLKWFGIDREATKDDKGEWKGQRWEVDIEEAGFKYHMNNISAAIGLSQLNHIEWILNQHRANASLYFGDFINHERDITPLKAYGWCVQPSHWVFTCVLDEGIDRDKVLELLNKQEIAAGVVHIPNHNYSCFKYDFRELPETDYFSKHQISLPCGWWLNTEDIRFISNAVLEAIDHARINNNITVQA